MAKQVLRRKINVLKLKLQVINLKFKYSDILFAKRENKTVVENNYQGEVFQKYFGQFGFLQASTDSY